MTDPQMDERRAARVRAELVRFAESSPTATAVVRGQDARNGQRRVALVTAVVLAVVISISIATLTATGGLGRHPAGPIPAPSQAYSGSYCALAPVQPFDCRSYRSVSGTDAGAAVTWLATMPVEGRFERAGSVLRFVLTGPLKASTIVVEPTTDGATGTASGDSSDALLDCASADSDCGHQSWLLRFFDRPTTSTVRGGTLVIRSGAQSITFEVTEDASPSLSDPPAAALLPVVWHVHDAAGEGTGTWLRFDVHEIDVLRPKGYVLVSWTNRQDEMIAVVSTWYRGMHGADTAVPWLTESTRFVRDGAGWQLLDAAGRVTARLEDDGPPPPSKVILETPVEVTAAVRRELADVVTPARASVDAGASLDGTWALPGVDPNRASITFTSGGTWSSIEPCSTGTNPQGTSGRFTLRGDGWLLAASAGRLTNGCFAPEAATNATAARAIAEIENAGSVRVSSTTLTVFDRAGHLLGALVRVP